MIKLLRLLNLSLLFTTRLPGWQMKESSEKELGQSGVFFPLIGLFIGLILYGEFLLLKDVNITTTTLLLIASGILINGGLHLDGYMDTMDGLLSGTHGQRMLEIMADSNVGAHSVSMMFVLLMTKAALLITLLVTNPVVLIIMPLIGRTLMLFSIIIFPYPKKNGIGAIYKENLSTSLVYLGYVLSLLLTAWFGYIYLLAWLLTSLSIFSFAKTITKKIGGLTGDSYGAVAEISEVMFLLFTFLILIIER